MANCPKCLTGYALEHFHLDGSECPNGRLEIKIKINMNVTKEDLKKAWKNADLPEYKFEIFCKLLGF